MTSITVIQMNLLLSRVRTEKKKRLGRQNRQSPSLKEILGLLNKLHIVATIYYFGTIVDQIAIIKSIDSTALTRLLLLYY